MKRLLALLALIASTASAAVVPTPGAEDPRIRWVRYDPEQVVELTGTLGYQMTIEFGPNERIENVSIGDSLGWQITPNRRASLLFVKPVMRAAHPTDMTVVTTLRRYTFDLTVRPTPRHGNDGVIYALRFVYPPPVALTGAPAAPPPKPEPEDVNHAYSYRGSSALLPARVFDDGHSTYFTFAANADIPAILALDGKHDASTVNSAMRDGYVVVDRLAPGFVLKRGKETTTIINDGWRAPEPGPLAPPRAGRGER
ncbi:MAG TPA: TrbG/VirB9 family P-type conjugative transfer protein [Sphingomonas sp.]|nr:TrbG/VirB9 family P-type conjugative transfer protein [Sphingomonas sp.]